MKNTLDKTTLPMRSQNDNYHIEQVQKKLFTPSSNMIRRPLCSCVEPHPLLSHERKTATSFNAEVQSLSA
ncbi:hypothetical protein [Filimonas effusa]|uniref:Uncharacterized protein n=1 Tax=Filimonas effusa TaxID=2508721 RepID=A0A4Q1DBB3_9BACT|nr:hypothetical protein [Filimonas effusa]RXK86744.1 hypothetical protein ESB13_08065 [Filimonas effusa]